VELRVAPGSATRRAILPRRTSPPPAFIDRHLVPVDILLSTKEKRDATRPTTLRLLLPDKLVVLVTRTNLSAADRLRTRSNDLHEELRDTLHLHKVQQRERGRGRERKKKTRTKRQKQKKSDQTSGSRSGSTPPGARCAPPAPEHCAVHGARATGEADTAAAGHGLVGRGRGSHVPSAGAGRMADAVGVDVFQEGRLLGLGEDGAEGGEKGQMEQNEMQKEGARGGRGVAGARQPGNEGGS